MERGTAPALSFLAEHGEYRRGVSTFPSLTPVCLSSIATGAHPRAPHPGPRLVRPRARPHRRVRLLVRRHPGSRVARALRDTVFTMNRDHLSRDTDDLRDARGAGLTTAAVNFTVYRGPVVHQSTLGSVARRGGAVALLLLQPLRVRPDGRAARHSRPVARLDRRVRRGGRPLARHARRVRLPRLLPARLRLRLARPRARRRAGGARAQRRRGRRAARGGRRRRRVSRPLRGDPLLRPRPDAGARRRAARARSRALALVARPGYDAEVVRRGVEPRRPWSTG